jgi:hypothetical protein
MSNEMLDRFMAITLLIIYTPLLTHRFHPDLSLLAPNHATTRVVRTFVKRVAPTTPDRIPPNRASF